MQTNLVRKLQKIIFEFTKISNFPKAILKHGTRIFLLILAAATLLVIYHRTYLNYDPYIDFIAASIIKASFIIEAEVIIGALVIDYLFKNK